MKVNVPLGYVPWHIVWLGSQPSHNQSRAHLVFWLKKGPFLAIFEMASSQQPSETETSYFQGYFDYIRGLQKCIWILETKPLILGPLRNPWFSQFLLLDRTCMQLLGNFIQFWKLHDLSYLWVENQQDKWLFHKKLCSRQILKMLNIAEKAIFSAIGMEKLRRLISPKIFLSPTWIRSDNALFG